MRRDVIFLTAALVLALFLPARAQADLSQKEARKAIQTMGGWSLPNDAVRIRSVNANNEASAEIEAVFRLRLRDAQWQLRELRTGPDRWERLELVAQAVNSELPVRVCDAPSQFARAEYANELTAKRARCLVADILGIALPSDDVRIKQVSVFGLSLGSESSALVVALIRADFRLVQVAKGWQVTGFKSGNREWSDVSGLPAAMDQLKRTAATDELSTLAKALGEFRRDRGSFVISDKESVLIDHLSPRYLIRVIRVDPWHRPYQYDGQADHYSLRSVGPDGKPNTPDDIVISGP